MVEQLKQIKTMKNIGLFAVMLSFILQIGNANAQITVTSTKNQNVGTLVQQYLLGTNLELVVDANHKATFNGKEVVQSNQLGSFVNLDTTGCNMPLDKGLVIATADCKVAGKVAGAGSGSASPASESLPDSGFYYTYNKYCVQNGYTPASMHDIGSLVFWVKPLSTTFAFTYCFASDEYPQYVYSTFNDFFGFYFSGPFDTNGNYINGYTAYSMQNIALVPGTNIPVMINTVNNGNNYGDPASYPEYHRVNCNNNCNLNEYSTALPTNIITVAPGGIYRVEIDICNISDHAYNSAIYFLKDTRRFDYDTLNVSICDEEEYYFPGLDTNLSTAGTYKFILFNETGGDSTITLNLTVNPTYFTSECWTLKQGEYIEINGNRIDRPGMYIAHLTTEEGCDSTIVQNFEWGEETKQVNCDSGLGDEINDGSNINLYPNPATNELTIEGLGYGARVEFVDLMGRRVMSANINNSEKIDVSRLDSGVYSVIIFDNNKYIKKKLIIQK